MSDHLKGLLLTSAGVMAIVPDSIFVRLIEAPHMTIVFWRAAFATLALFAGLAFTYGTALPRVVMALGRAGAAYALLFSLGTGLFVLAVQLTTIAKAVLIVSGTPVFAALLSWRFMGEPLSRRMGWTIAVTMAGVAIITFGGDGGARANALAGELCALGTALAMAGALTLARANRHISMVPAAGAAYLLTTLVTLPFCAPSTMQAMDWIHAAVLGCVFISLGTCLLTLGPRYISAAEVSLLLLLEATFAPILAWIVLDEIPSVRTLVGGGIIIGALAVSNALVLGTKKPEKRPF